MNVLVIGSGGREHALAWKIAQSFFVKTVFCAPGNAGTNQIATNVDINPNDFAALIDFVKKEKIDLTIVGPEEPLTRGIVDAFRQNGLMIFGPNAKAAMLEGSKSFTKNILRKYGIPSAKYERFTDPERAERYVKDHNIFPIVIKADGLAAGKGVFICNSFNESIVAIQEIMVDRQFGIAGASVVIEEFLQGEEASYIVMVDYNGNVLPLASSQDHKRRSDGDIGPNTGGMGAYSPAPVVTPEMEKRILNQIIYPTVAAMEEEGCQFTGFLYAGIMIDSDGKPWVLEFNVRLGDPETQPILARMETDLITLMSFASRGKLDECEIKWNPQPAVCVVMVAEGYPGSYEKGISIDGIKQAEETGAMVFHAGTTLDAQCNLVSSGGRVLGVTALGKDFTHAQQNAYQAVGEIKSAGLFYRSDIADRAIGR